MSQTTVLGLLGGIGSGKSTVAALLAAQGAIVLDADALAHQVLEEPEIRAQIVAAFGEGICDEDGAISRAALGTRVFSDPGSQELSVLEAIIHPRVRQIILDELARSKRISHPLVVLDIPLLIESPLLAECHQLLFVEAHREQRVQRVQQRGWDAAELDRREALQTPLDQKKQQADFIVPNQGDPDDVRAWIEEFYQRMTNDLVGDCNGQDRQEEKDDC